MTQSLIYSPTDTKANVFSIYDEITTLLNKQFIDLDSMQLLLQIGTNVSKGKEQFLQQYLYGLLPKSARTAFTNTRAPTEEEQQWLGLVEEQMALNLTAYEFTLNRLSQLIFLSPRQIRRRLRRLTGMTFSQYLKAARLERAYLLLQSEEVKSVKMLANKVGMRDVKYFSQQFKVHFGKLPSAYLYEQ